MLNVHGFLALFSFTLPPLGKFIALDKMICSCYYLQAQEVLKEHPRYKKDEKIQGMRNTLILGSVMDLNQIFLFVLGLQCIDLSRNFFVLKLHNTFKPWHVSKSIFYHSLTNTYLHLKCFICSCNIQSYFHLSSP